MNKPLEHRLALALAALAAAEKNARDATKNPVYWKTQVEREQKLIEALEAELREPEVPAAEIPAGEIPTAEIPAAEIPVAENPAHPAP